MVLRNRYLFAALLILSLSATAANAQDYAAVARNTGHRDGLEKGRNDAAQNKSYRLDRHDYFKDADHGYRSSFGNRDSYRQIYRDAFQNGYEQGYRGSGRPAGGFGERAPEVRLPGSVDYGASPETARNTGYRDGKDKGEADAQEAKSFNPERHDLYRQADHGYRDRFGNRDAYRQEYRDGFRRGYEDGYRQRDRFGRDRDRDRPGMRREGDRVIFGPRGTPEPVTATGAGADAARNTGYRDGLEKGRNDAAQSKSFRLDRHDYFKDADHGYRSSFGDKEAYRQVYREGFQRGYEAGYRRR